MPHIWIDIETLPSKNKPDHKEITAPANYKDPEKIEKFQIEAVDKVWKDQALESLQGRICCISWAIGNAPPVCHGIWDKTLKNILELLENDVQEVASNNDDISWGGFYLKSFDLNWIWHRAVKYDFPTLKDYIPRSRYPASVLDVRDLWTGGEPRAKGKLKEIATFLGLEIIDDMDGSKVFDLFMNEEFDKIAKYCKHDVELTRSIAWIMGKGNPPLNFKKYIKWAKKKETTDSFLTYCRKASTNVDPIECAFKDCFSSCSLMEKAI